MGRVKTMIIFAFLKASNICFIQNWDRDRLYQRLRAATEKTCFLFLSLPTSCREEIQSISSWIASIKKKNQSFPVSE